MKTCTDLTCSVGSLSTKSSSLLEDLWAAYMVALEHLVFVIHWGRNTVTPCTDVWLIIFVDM